MNKNEIDQAIRKQFLCRIAFSGQHGPQIAPFQYVYMDNRLYFHFTNYGSKIEFLDEGKQVCVEIENYTPDFSEYSFVALNGFLKVVEDIEEKRRVIAEMSEVGKAKLSTNFLYAHGFESKSGWSVFDSNLELLIVKLDKIESLKGLKSP